MSATLPPTDALHWALTHEQMEIVTEIRDLLRVLVDDRLREEDAILARAEAIKQRRASAARERKMDVNEHGVALRHKERIADLYGTVTLAERADGYFYLAQPRDPDDYDEKDEVIAFGREAAVKLHAALGKWLST